MTSGVLSMSYQEESREAHKAERSTSLSGVRSSAVFSLRPLHMSHKADVLDEDDYRALQVCVHMNTLACMHMYAVTQALYSVLFIPAIACGIVRPVCAGSQYAEIEEVIEHRPTHAPRVDTCLLVIPQSTTPA